MTEPEGRARSVASEIARYLERRPDASDTEEGVMRWWIPRVRLEEEMAIVRSALALLVAQGMVERLILQGGLVMFRRLHHGTGAEGPHVPAGADSGPPVPGG
jgi:hypothetical protein